MSRRKKKPSPLQPYRPCEDDPEFQALDETRRTYIIHLLDWVMDMDKSPSPFQRAQYIAEHYKTTDAGEKKRPGFSYQSIYRHYRRWVNNGRNWRVLDKYRSLRLGEAPPVQSYNITAKSAHEFFRRMGTTQREWERKHNFGKNTVSAAITGIRNNKKCQMILDTLSEEMRAEPGGWEQTISAMKEEADGMRKQLADFTRRLQYIEKRAIPWMNFCRTASSPSSLP